MLGGSKEGRLKSKYGKFENSFWVEFNYAFVIIICYDFKSPMYHLSCYPYQVPVLIWNPYFFDAQQNIPSEAIETIIHGPIHSMSPNVSEEF